MKYLTTLEVARQLNVSKQTLLNWLYAGKIPEPPRNRKRYRLWSPSRVSLVRRLIRDGRLNKRTVVHSTANADLLPQYAREVAQFVREAGIDAETFLKELARQEPAFARARRRRGPSRR
jgi:excisionase family DNA binding protein